MLDLNKIREVLQESKRPLFIFNDDADGLCSFLLLRHFIGEGSGIPVKDIAEPDEYLIRRVKLHDPDLIIITDIPVVCQEFVNEVKTKILWIDHHPPKKVQNVLYHNPRLKNPDVNIPATLLAYDIVKQNLWLAVTGCIADWYFPDKLVKKFRKEYPKLLPENITDPDKAIYDSKIGLLGRIFNFMLKGRAANVRKNISIFMKIEDPSEILEQSSPRGKYIYKHFKELMKNYDVLLKKALGLKSKDKLFVFVYHESMSFTSQLSNELLYRMKDKIIVVSKEKDGWMRTSLRSPENIDVSKALEKAMVNIEGYGGGHMNACGCSVKKEQWDTFLEQLREALHL